MVFRLSCRLIGDIIAEVEVKSERVRQIMRRVSLADELDDKNFFKGACYMKHQNKKEIVR
ncbi:hypothetical protein Awo_c33890 [Acetobacterium woodii DSM 1030]|uniref:Uncharacterized protein n=2 Tax=Acetobacterium woodii TaxID=33952 RepID=H6LBJ4_ACEWD|nr:hypothetical protein Awo_c33890 [Acetobacterium woodii DSM 1030]